MAWIVHFGLLTDVNNDVYLIRQNAAALSIAIQLLRYWRNYADAREK